MSPIEAKTRDLLDPFGALGVKNWNPGDCNCLEDIKPAGQIVEEMVQGAVEQLQTVPWAKCFFQARNFYPWSSMLVDYILFIYSSSVCFKPRMKCWTSLNSTSVWFVVPKSWALRFMSDSCPHTGLALSNSKCPTAALRTQASNFLVAKL